MVFNVASRPGSAYRIFLQGSTQNGNSASKGSNALIPVGRNSVPMSQPKAKILAVDDEPNVLVTVEAILQREGYEVEIAGGGAAAVEAIRCHHYDLVLTDLKMPEVDGLAVLAEVRKVSPETVTVMMTGYGSVSSALEAVQLGAYEYLMKPMEVPELKLAVRRSLERKRLSEIDTLYSVSQIITSSLDHRQIAAEVSDAVMRVLRVCTARLVTFSDRGDPHCNVQLTRLLMHPKLLQRLRAGETVTDPDAPRQVRQTAAASGLKAYAFVPGVVNRRLVCVLFASNAQDAYEFHASALRFLQAVAGQSALALANAGLFAELQAKNRDLESANSKLKELDKLKSDFLSVATHELRTPLTVILGYNTMLAESLQQTLSPDQSQILGESITACKRLIRLVNSMLDITQIQTGKMQMNFAPADLRKIVSGVAALFQAEARAKGVNLHLQLPVHLPKLVMDSDRMEQVLVNLLGNALKFTPAGGNIRLGVRLSSGSGPVEISVSDTGIGIAPENLELIFDQFTQVRQHAAQRQREGSGLGLAIAKRIVEAHAGNISVNSTPGEGSTFTVTLPARATLISVGNAIPA